MHNSSIQDIGIKFSLLAELSHIWDFLDCRHEMPFELASRAGSVWLATTKIILFIIQIAAYFSILAHFEYDTGGSR